MYLATLFIIHRSPPAIDSNFAQSYERFTLFLQTPLVMAKNQLLQDATQNVLNHHSIKETVVLRVHKTL